MLQFTNRIEILPRYEKVWISERESDRACAGIGVRGEIYTDSMDFRTESDRAYAGIGVRGEIYTDSMDFRTGEGELHG